MTAAGPYTDNLAEVWKEMRDIKAILMRMARQVEAIYNDDPSMDKADEDLTAEERIKKYGQAIPYTLIDDSIEIERFREFLYNAKKNGRNLTQMERDLLDVADKNFDDIRLSVKHVAVLKNIYQKLFNRPWPFKHRQGYMYKLEGYQPEWEFFDNREEVR